MCIRDRPYRLSVVSIVILTFLSSMLQLYLPTLTADIVDVGIVQGAVSYTHLTLPTT
ncbi:hypothetical protein H8946_18520, partial [Bacillus pumilus]|nr:hypothetical protein [Bacillus pumilus]